MIQIFKQIIWVIWEVIIFSVLFLFGHLLFQEIIYWVSGEERVSETDLSLLLSNPFQILLLSYLPLFMAMTLSWYLVHVNFFKRSPRSGGWHFSQAIRYTLVGLGIGFGLVCSGFLLMWGIGVIEITTLNVIWSLILGFALFFFVQSGVEEIALRCFLIPLLETRINTFVALLISSSVFSIIHLSNPGFSVIGSIVIFLGGLITGLLFLKYRSFWIVTGFHASWNYVQATFFDFNVSGINVYSVINFELVGSEVWTGGQFGYEGTLISVIICSLSICWFFFRNPPLGIRENYFNYIDILRFKANNEPTMEDALSSDFFSNDHDNPGLK